MQRMKDAPQFLVKPRFNALKGAMYFPVESLNAFQKAEYNDNFGFYQSTFGIYSYMTMTDELTYRIHYPKGTPLLWQPHNSCAWTPTGTLSMGQMEITPTKAKINEQLCYDENFDSAYKAWLKWGSNPMVEMSAAGMAATDALTHAIVMNATMGARASMVAGRLHDLDAVTMATGTATRIVQAFEKTAGTIKGWIELLKLKATEDASTYGHLNNATLITSANISNNGETYTGATKSVVQLYDENVAISPKPLRKAVVQGGVGGFNNAIYSLWMVSNSLIYALDLEFKAQGTSAATNNPRISTEIFEVDTERGKRKLTVYKIDNTIVVPVDEVDVYEQYITGTSHFCFLTVSGVIQLGGSFGKLPIAGESNVGVMVQRTDDVDEMGVYKFGSHALMATAVNDTNYIAGGYAFAEPS